MLQAQTPYHNGHLKSLSPSLVGFRGQECTGVKAESKKPFQIGVKVQGQIPSVILHLESVNVMFVMVQVHGSQTMNGRDSFKIKEA